MTIEDKLRELILERYGSVFDFSKEIDMANSTLASILNRGIHKASVGNIIKICTALDISADGLAVDKIIPNGTETKHKDIYDVIAVTRLNMSSITLTLDGEPLTDGEKDALVDALELCAEFIKRNHTRNNLN